jgi:hypothetical protein
MAHPTPGAGNAAGQVCLERKTIADDLLRGASAIAEFMFGDRRKRRQVYHLAQTGQLPVFKLGATLCARRSTLIAWIEAQEAGFNG